MTTQPSSLDTEHEALVSAAAALTEILATFDRRLVRKDVDHDVHRQFARRAFYLSLQCRAILGLVRSDLYPSAFVLIRSALEHQLLDELIMLGNRYVRTFGPVSDEEFDKLVSEYRDGQHPSIAEEPARTKRGGFRLTLRGLFDSKADPAEDPPSIAIQFFAERDYDPTAGRVDTVGFFVEDRFHSEEAMRDRGAHHQKLWNTHLRWASIRDGLTVNGFMNEDDVRRLDVHYSFLSGFAHASTAALRSAYDDRGILTSVPPTYDHSSSELALLYLVTIASDELSSLLRMSGRKPVIAVSEREDLEALIRRSRGVSAHLWFARGVPHLYDKVQEANHRAFENQVAKRVVHSPVPPEAIPDSEVRYYRDPMRRLVQMHSSFNEIMSGLTYRSPFERADALRRRS